MGKSYYPTVFQSLAAAAGILAFLFALIYGRAGLGVILLCLIPAALLEYLYEFRKEKIINPYFAMMLAPLFLINYSSITDFRIRLLGFFILIYIIAIAYSFSVRKIKFSLISAKPFNVWLFAFILFTIASGLLWVKGIHLSGDEPHYVMITQSIVNDGDFDLKNNYQEKEYLEYIPIEVRFHGGDFNGKYLSFHLPGVSFLLIPFYWLFKLLGGLVPPSLFFRIVASLLNAFFALCLFYILKKKFHGKDITGFWVLMLVLYPMIFHAIHLYPELPAATLMMAAYYFSLFDKKKYVLSGLFLSLIPWFHVKYIPPLILIAGVIVFNLLKPLSSFRVDKNKVINVLKFFIFPVISFVLLLLYCKTLYGSFSPTAVYPQESYISVPWLLRLKVFLAYFLDQRDGLLFYSPLFFLFFFSFKRKMEHKILLISTAFIYVFFHAYTTVRGAYAPAGRPLMFVSWIFILLIAHFYFSNIKEESGFPFNFIFRFLAGTGFFILAWLFYYPLFVYQPVFAATTERASGMNLFLGSDFIELWKIFPSFLTKPLDFQLANIIWIALLLITLLFFYIRSSNYADTSQPRFMIIVLSIVLFFAMTFAFCFYPHVHLLSQNKYTGKVISFYNNSRNFLYLPDRNGFRIKAGNNYDIFIDRNLLRKDKVNFRFTNIEGNSITIRNGKHLLFESPPGEKKGYSCVIPVSNLDFLKVNNKSVSHLGIETQTTLSESFLWLEIE